MKAEVGTNKLHMPLMRTVNGKGKKGKVMGIANQAETERNAFHKTPSESEDRSRAVCVAGSDLTHYANPPLLLA